MGTVQIRTHTHTHTQAENFRVNVSEHRLRVLTVKTSHVHLMDEEAGPKEQGLILYGTAARDRNAMPAAGSSSKLWAGQASQLGVRGPAAAQGSCRTHVSGVTVAPGAAEWM